MRAVLLAALIIFPACKKHEPKPTPDKVEVTRDGTRKVPIEATMDGYKPDKIPGKPGEKLILVFTRTAESECIEQLVTPDKQTVDLPMNKPVEVAVTVPQSGRVEFACGMNMYKGVVVADPTKS